MTNQPSRRLAAIMAADIVGYSKMMAEDEDRTLAKLRSFRTDLLERAVSDNAGTIIKNMGDGWLTEFNSIVGAVNCATEIQKRLSEADDLEIRIGIHVGDIIHEDDDIFGDGVNIASRLQQLAAPGAVLVSGDVHKMIDRKTETEFEDLGVQKLKNITVETAVYGWAPSVTTDKPLLTSEPVAKLSQGLPTVFVEELRASGNREDASDLAEEIRYELLLLLSKRTGIKVVSERGEQNPPKYVLGGRCRVSGERSRVDMTLETGGGETIWTERFESDAETQDEFAETVAQHVSVAFRAHTTTLDGADIAMRPDAELSTEELLSKAAFHNLRWTREGIEIGQASLEAAIAKSPDNATAHSMLAISHASPLFIGHGRIVDIDRDRALELADRGVSLSRNSDVVFFCRASCRLWFKKDYQGALSDIDRALKVNPGFQEALVVRGLVETFSGEPEKGIARLIDSLDMLSRGTLNPVILFAITIGQILAGNDDAALTYGREAYDSAPSIPNCGVAYAVAAAGNPELTGTDEFAAMIDRLGLDLSIVHNYPLKNQADIDLLTDRLRTAGVPG
ncbi:adenylate/guanylate cyclase domain-containing protein [Hoeflea prorocentri]|uniref:Guanylate cyclase domain-containing protein n=1 Tax=Hoeflea prorocentri TaxID=1922333 RepID=A0A9X3ULC1_9HYPH|nr:adenylate/guanylate cyclase domain-containing protein [Hoeflea prorocentri]MCY6382960.1 hypothetical protein [Hoeflea prorocentri]MDA5400760.1 hypothetical protein [Hoeflea prorocentri]